MTFISNAFVDYSTSGLENPLAHLLIIALVLVALGAERTARHGSGTLTALWLVAALMAFGGVSFLARSVHPRSTAAWAMAVERLLWCQVELLLAVATLHRRAAHRAWLQLCGALEGLRPPAEGR